MTDILSLLGDDASGLLDYQCQGIDKSLLHLPGSDFIAKSVAQSDRTPAVLRNLQSIFDHGRLAGTGYMSVLPVDQGVEHTAGASFSVTPLYFDPSNIVELAIEGGCNAVASTVGVLGAVARQYAHRIPFIVKLNHNELLSYPNRYDQVMFATVKQAFDLGATAVGATVYFGSDESHRQIEEVGRAFACAHELGLVTVLWAYLRNEAFKTPTRDYHTAADLTGQANHLAVTLQADIVKQKQADCNAGFADLYFGKTHPKMYTELSKNHPIELARYQVANCYMGRVGMINSGGPSGTNDLRQAVYAALINKRAGGMGLISGRKAFQKPMAEGVELLHAIQDVYRDKRITVA
tara:strand:+ start:12164 stop:13213 length:1050 start_codon:yes stop_codon:yes gene_type:complete